MQSQPVRPRRLRQHPQFRAMIRETELRVSDLILPLFVDESITERAPVSAMPGVFRLPLRDVAAEAKSIASLGIPAVILFGIPRVKDAAGSAAAKPDGIIQKAVKAIKDSGADVRVMTDVCYCEYTDHGHCGVLHSTRHGARDVDNDATLPLLVDAALSHVRAGADMVAPSDMMDGRVGAIRLGLDAAGFSETPILAYSVKYASAFYGPFRAAADSAPAFGDRQTYQMDPANREEALREARLDLQEGADILMVKPALAYLDVIRDVKQATGAPLAAYNVSGEYAMVKAAAANGWLEEKRTVLEILTSIRRAGADMILTYHARDAAQWLNSR